MQTCPHKTALPPVELRHRRYVGTMCLLQCVARVRKALHQSVGQSSLSSNPVHARPRPRTCTQPHTQTVTHAISPPKHSDTVHRHTTTQTSRATLDCTDTHLDPHPRPPLSISLVLPCRLFLFFGLLMFLSLLSVLHYSFVLALALALSVSLCPSLRLTLSLLRSCLPVRVRLSLFLSRPSLLSLVRQCSQSRRETRK